MVSVGLNKKTRLPHHKNRNSKFNRKIVLCRNGENIYTLSYTPIRLDESNTKFKSWS